MRQRFTVGAKTNTGYGARQMSTNSQATPRLDAWDDYLDPGETILWQGGPDPRFKLTGKIIRTALFGAAFAGFAVIWMFGMAQAGGSVWMFGLIHFSVGIGIIGGAVFWPTWRRRHSWYTLTDRRAFIATALPFSSRKLKSYPITKDTPIEFDNATWSTIYFHKETRRRRNRDRVENIGFENLPDGQHVYKLIRKIQQSETAP